jgi:hypothetical protein
VVTRPAQGCDVGAPLSAPALTLAFTRWIDQEGPSEENSVREETTFLIYSMWLIRIYAD